MLVAATIAGRRAGRIARVLAHEPWRPVPSQLQAFRQDLGFRVGSAQTVVIEGSAGTVAVEPEGLARTDPSYAPEAWIAGPRSGALVLAAPGGGRVVAVRVMRR